MPHPQRSLQPPAFRKPRFFAELAGIGKEDLAGGGEYGKEWHEAGTKTRKQNVFDDFIAAAEWLIDNRYTRPAKLAISGRQLVEIRALQ